MNGPRVRGSDLFNLPLDEARMTRVGPLLTKTRADIRRRRDNEKDDTKPHLYLSERCFVAVTPFSRCFKEHYHVKGIYLLYALDDGMTRFM